MIREDQPVHPSGNESTLQGKTIVITAGPTREYLDPIRFISNRSSGKMGYALATEAKNRGAEVFLVSGPTELESPDGVIIQRIVSARDMLEAVKKHSSEADIFIFAAAVCDYRPDSTAPQKIKKSAGPMHLPLALNPDIAAEISKSARSDQILVGFAAETQNLLESAREKLKEKKFKIIVANDVSTRRIGMESDENEAVIINSEGKEFNVGPVHKRVMASRILDEIEKYHNKSS